MTEVTTPSNRAGTFDDLDDKRRAKVSKWVRGRRKNTIAESSASIRVYGRAPGVLSDLCRMMECERFGVEN
jgi:hypothetical protein